MKAHGKKILFRDENYKDMLRYDHFCYEKLVEAGYSPQGWDRKTDTICIIKHKDPKKYWDIEGREIYYFDSYIDAAEKLIAVTQDDFELKESEKNKPLHITRRAWADAEMFDRIAKAGDSVDEEIVEEFRNALSPIINGREFMQAGGEFADVFIKELNTYAPLYATFKKCVTPTHPEGIWVFLGNCLRGNQEDLTEKARNQF